MSRAAPIRVIIPARRNSQRLPFKNRRYIGDKMLVEHTILPVKDWFDHNDWSDMSIIVATNDKVIKAVATEHGLNTFSTKENQHDDTSAMNALRDYARSYNYNKFLLLQPTSPFRTVGDLNTFWKGVKMNSDQNCVYCGTKNNPCGCFYYFNRTFLDDNKWTGREGIPFRAGHQCHDIDTKEELQKAREMYK